MGLKKKNPFKSAIENLRHPRSIKDKGQRTMDKEMSKFANYFWDVSHIVHFRTLNTTSFIEKPFRFNFPSEKCKISTSKPIDFNLDDNP